MTPATETTALSDANPDQILIRQAIAAQALDLAITTSPVLADLGAHFIGGETGSVRFRFTAHERARQGDGLIHGGVLTTMMDSAMAFAALSMLEDHESVATISLNINFMRPALQDACEVEGIIENAGRKILFAHAAVYTTDGKCLAKSTSTMARIRRNDAPPPK